MIPQQLLLLLQEITDQFWGTILQQFTVRSFVFMKARYKWTDLAYLSSRTFLFWGYKFELHERMYGVYRCAQCVCLRCIINNSYLQLEAYEIMMRDAIAPLWVGRRKFWERREFQLQSFQYAFFSRKKKIFYIHPPSCCLINAVLKKHLLFRKGIFMRFKGALHVIEKMYSYFIALKRYKEQLPTT